MGIPSRRSQFTPVGKAVNSQAFISNAPPPRGNRGPIRKQSREERKHYMREYMRDYRRKHPGLSTPYVRKYRAKKRDQD